MSAQPSEAQSRSASERPRPRRVVTGENENGRSVIISDGPAPHQTVPGAVPGMQASVLWVTDCSPARVDGDEETAPADLDVAMGPPTGGTLLRIADIPPEAEFDDVDMAAVFAHINRGDDPRQGVPDDSRRRHFFFHKTPTIDYAIVLEGEVWALLDDDETCLKVGDVLIQRATSHSWANRSDQPARLAFILIDAEDHG